MVLMLTCTLSLAACGNSKKEEAVSKQEAQAETENNPDVVVEEEIEEEIKEEIEEEIEEEISGINDDGKGEEISGINDDGKGEEISGINDDGKGEEISGINDDGIGYDPNHGEGIGEVIALTPEEESYMLAQTTNTWLEMSQQDKDDLVVLIGRSLEASHNYIVADYDELVMMLDNQTEKYFRNGVDESVLATVKDILGLY